MTAQRLRVCTRRTRRLLLSERLPLLPLQIRPLMVLLLLRATPPELLLQLPLLPPPTLPEETFLILQPQVPRALMRPLSELAASLAMAKVEEREVANKVLAASEDPPPKPAMAGSRLSMAMCAPSRVPLAF